ncbi:DUF3667 domain-containing protein [Maricaulis maris]|uniref:DUF3667 domain-containing protein n=1 Tax=Maricaulis maris TaxID=74318 RepID=UPI003A9168CD
MTNQSSANLPSGTCANCGAALDGPFCGQCGQSREEIRRPAWMLVTDTVGDVLVWDGRFLTTLRALFAGPGTLARSYADGQRARWTPPIRLYLLVSLAFFAAMGLAGVRVIAVAPYPAAETVRAQDEDDIQRRMASIETARARGGTDAASISCGVMPGPDEINADGQLVYAADGGVNVTMMQRGASPEPRRIDRATADCLRAVMADAQVPAIIAELTIGAIRDPAGFEASSSAAAAQALILMVLAMALINLLLHPRRTVIEHVILSLYFHAALLPGFAIVLLLANLVAGSIGAYVGVAILALAGQFALTWLCDRQFYGSSWYGALLRLPVQITGYAAALTAAALGLILLPAL